MEEKTNVVTIEDTNLKSTLTHQALASCICAFITSILVTPFDVIKTRLQAQTSALSGRDSPLRFAGTIVSCILCDALQKITRHEGVTRLWSGLPVSLLLAVPTTVIYFCTYEQLRVVIRRKYIENDSLSTTQPVWISVVAGAGARVCTAAVVSPLELVRTNIQSAKVSYRELLKTLQSSVKTKGYTVLWKGVFSTLYRDVTFSAVYWFNYETLKDAFHQQAPTFGFSFIAGGAAGAISTSVTVPFDVIKTNQQVDFQVAGKSGRPTSALNIATSIYSSHGVRGLFAGLVPRLMRIVPSCAITISTIEYSKMVLRDKTRKKKDKIAVQRV